MYLSLLYYEIVGIIIGIEVINYFHHHTNVRNYYI